MRSATDPTLPGRTVVIATFNPATGMTGVQTHTRSLGKGLKDAGVGCHIVSPFTGSRAWLALFAVRPLLLKRLSPTHGTLWYRHWHAAALRTNLRRVLKSGHVSHVIAQCPPSAQAALDVRDELGLFGRLGVTLVCHFNESEADEYRAQGVLGGLAYDRVKAAEERTIRAVDRVIYVSSWARDLVERHRGIQTRASTVVWNGIAAEQADARAADRATLGLTAGDVLLINVGTLEPRKDQIGLLQLFARARAEFSQARLLLVGDGPQRGAIEAEARALGVSESVKLLGHRDDVPALLRMADLYVHHAAAENCPMVLLEASRAGLPWAARPSGGVGELARALHGVALSAESPEQSLALLRPLLADAGVRHAVGRRSYEAFLAGFTQQAMTRGYLDALGLVAEPRAAA